MLGFAHLDKKFVKIPYPGNTHVCPLFFLVLTNQAFGVPAWPLLILEMQASIGAGGFLPPIRTIYPNANPPSSIILLQCRSCRAYYCKPLAGHAAWAFISYKSFTPSIHLNDILPNLHQPWLRKPRNPFRQPAMNCPLNGAIRNCSVRHISPLFAKRKLTHNPT